MKAAWLAAFVALLAALGGCASPPSAAPDAALDAMQARPERMIVVAVPNPRPVGSVVAGSTSAGYDALLPYQAGATARRAIAEIARTHGLREVVAWPISALRVHCAVLELPAGVDRDALIAALSRDLRVEIVQPLQAFEVQSTPGWNDPYAPLQHGLAAVGAASAHAASRGRGVGVAIVDTGVDTAHPDLDGRVVGTRNLVDRDAAQFARDRHGTQVAGVIAAVANNRLGIVGVAPEATLRVYKACWQGGDGRTRCNSFTLALALAAGLDDGARVLNLSLAGPPDGLLARLVARALAEGRVVVGAVPPDGALDGFPLGVPGVVAVDSTGRAERRGVLQAPGRDILTTVPGGRWDFGSGSSLAAAHVSGVVALLLAMPDAPRPDAVQPLLEGSRAGGSVSACRAIAALRGGRDGCDAPAAR